MSYLFRTISGSTYVVHEGILARMADEPMTSAVDGTPDPATIMHIRSTPKVTGVPVPPRCGAVAIFRTRESGQIITNVVADVRPVTTRIARLLLSIAEQTPVDIGGRPHVRVA